MLRARLCVLLRRRTIDDASTANRLQLVDFTLSYMASGISMVVPFGDQSSKRS
jgi:hypothetical protein